MKHQNQHRWNSAHIYYNDDKDPLLIHCIKPLAQTLKQENLIERFFFERHWQGGPHLRLRFYADESVFERAVKPRLESEIGAYLQQCPSTKQIKEEDVRQFHEQLALKEVEEGEFVPLYPNNSIQYIPYVPKTKVFLGEQGVELIEDYYEATNEVVFSILERTGNDRAKRLQETFDLMVITAATLVEIKRSFLAYRSHAEGFIGDSLDPLKLRQHFDARYESQRLALQARIQRITDSLDSGLSDGSIQTTWAEITRAFNQRSKALISSGQVKVLVHEDMHALWQPAHIEEFYRRRETIMANSEFHAALQTNEAAQKFMQTDVEFLSVRLILNYMYLTIVRLGVSPMEKFFLAYLIARSVEEMYSISTVESIKAYSGTTA
jgi:hypothetical protein